MFIEVVFPLPFRKAFTYKVPEEFAESIKIGLRVAAPFGKRILTGFIINIFNEEPKIDTIKNIYDVLDEIPIFDSETLKFYEWISEYYLSSLGEALKHSVPSGLDVETKKRIIIDKYFCIKLLNEENKNPLRKKILKVLTEHEEISLTFLQQSVKKKNIYYLIRSLEKAGVITVVEEVEKAKVNIKKVNFVKLAKSMVETYDYIPSIEKKSPKQLAVLLFLLNKKGKPIQLSKLLAENETTHSTVKSLEKKGLINIYEEEVERKYVEEYSEELILFQLTEEQKEVISSVENSIDKNEFQTYLLHGVTGSGKTQVYIELIKKVLTKGKSALLLVPEISLTPQITKRLLNSLGNNVSVQHSRMSLGERYDAWRKILKGECKVVVGARSALFAPLNNLGIIIVDEEHDGSYKQSDIVPKYQGRDSAIVRGKFSNCPVLLGSATPSVDSMFNAINNKYKLLKMPSRIDDAKLPEITLVNLIAEKKKTGIDSIFSKTLLDKIEDRINKKEGVIILQNRRGFASQVYCNDCGEIETCENCSVSMVLHLYTNTIECHYCGLKKKVPNACTKCGSLSIKYYGTGTERVEDEISYYLPNAKVERVDSDSIRKKGSLGLIFNKFNKGEIDVLVGTQLVSKGLDFSHVTLVGVIAAETTLWLPDFRADERTFQLLTQVAGRSGRSKTAGEVLIQTQNEKHFVLQKVLNNDYEGFYKREIIEREKLKYPPFVRICVIESKDKSEEKAKGAITDFYQIIKKFSKWLKINPPTQALLFKLLNNFRFHIVIKDDKNIDPGGAILRKAILESISEFNIKSRFRDVKILIDIDPQSIV